MASIPRKPVGSRPTIDVIESYGSSQDRTLQEEDDPKDNFIMQDHLLRDIANKLGIIAETSVHELRSLRSVSDRISLLEASKVEFVWNAVLQTVGIIFVIIFGVFAVLAYNANEIANRQSFESNQLSLLSYCNQFPGNGLCAAISQQASAPLTSLATAVMGPTIQLTPTTSPMTSETAAPSTDGLTSSTAPTSSAAASTSTSTSASTTATLSATPSTTEPNAGVGLSGSGSTPHSLQHLSNPVIAGIVVGVFSIIMSIGASWFGFRANFKGGQTELRHLHTIFFQLDKQRLERLARATYHKALECESQLMNALPLNRAPGKSARHA